MSCDNGGDQFVACCGHSCPARTCRSYEHTHAICNALNGVPAPKLPQYLEDKLKHMFGEIQEPFEKHCPPTRKNFLSYSFVLYKFCELLGEVRYRLAVLAVLLVPRPRLLLASLLTLPPTSPPPSPCAFFDGYSDVPLSAAEICGEALPAGRDLEEDMPGARLGIYQEYLGHAFCEHNGQSCAEHTP